MSNVLRFRNLVVATALVAAAGCRTSETKTGAKVVETSNEMANANADFEARRQVRYEALTAELQVINTQPQLINAIAQNFPLTAESRTDVVEKLQTLQVDYDQARNQVELLKTSSAGNFKDADDKARDAMDKLHDANKDAWDAVTDARRTDRSS